VYNSTEIGFPDDPNMITPIERISNNSNEKSFKLLGVLLDEHLSFKYHIDMLCAKLSKSLYCLSRVKHFIDQESLKKLYYSMIHSNLAYGINIYGCVNSTTLDKLRKKQKQAIRTLCNANYRAHTAPLFREMKILPLDQLIIYSNIKFMHSFIHKKLPLSFNNTWQTNEERNPVRILRNINDLFIPAHRVEFVKRLPLFSFPATWNNAPGNKYNPRPSVYMNEVKTYLLSLL
jgi:hypothetical protein